jgi:GNAT superfamily N-acetyltransferase
MDDSPAKEHIRLARLTDMARIHEIRFAVHENKLSDPSFVTQEDVVWFIENPGIWVWDEGGHVIGFSAGDPRDGSVWALFVDPAHERRGIGRALFHAALGTLRDAGHRSATLPTEPGTRAERFYRAAGWTVIGRTAKGELLFRSAL